MMIALSSCSDQTSSMNKQESISGSKEKTTTVTVSSSLSKLRNSSFSEDTDRYQLPQIDTEVHLEIPKKVSDGDVYGSVLYYLVEEKSAVYTLDLTSGENSVFSEDIGRPRNLCTDADGVYVYDMRAEEIVRFSFEGQRTDSVPIPVKPHGGQGYIAEYYVATLEHCDGLLMFAVRDGVWTIEDGSSKWQLADIGLLASEKVNEAAIRSKKKILIEIENMPDPYGAREMRFLECDRKGGHARSLPADFSQDIMTNQNHIYQVSARGTRLNEITDTSSIYLMTPGPEDGSPISSVKRFAISNNTLAVLWSVQPVFSLFPLPDSDHTVCILSPKSEEFRADRLVNAVTSVSAQYTTFDDSSFFEKLSTSLLGKDDTFDIALVSGSAEQMTTLLRAVLQNHQYVNLDQGEGLHQNLLEMFPGTRSLLNYKNEVAVLPLGFDHAFYGFTQTAQNSGILLPGSDWTVDHLLAMTDELKSSGLSVFSKNTYINEPIILSMAISSIQADMNLTIDDKTEKASAALTGLFEKLDRCARDGVLFGSKPVFASAGYGVFTPEGALSSVSDLQLSLVPAVQQKGRRPANHPIMQASPTSGKQPLTVTGFLFINPNSKKMAEALSVIYDLTNEENRYNALIYDSPLWPDLSKYYRDVTMSLDPETNEYTYDPHRELVVNQEHWEYYMMLNDFLPVYYEGSELCLVSVSGRAEQAVTDFCEGMISGEDCAKVLYEEIVYKLRG